MNSFKKVCFSAVTMTAMTAGSVMLIESAHAASLTDGSLNITTDTFVSKVNSAGDLNMVIKASGVPIANGGFAGFTGSPVFKTLSLAKIASTSWTTGPVADFMQGIAVGGDNVFFDILSPITFTGSFLSATNYSLVAPILDGQFRNASGQILGLGAITGVRFSSTADSSSVNLVATAVPTPALLPALLGMGAAAWRKRKSQEELVEA
jgi:hypothetical protein